MKPKLKPGLNPVLQHMVGVAAAKIKVDELRRICKLRFENKQHLLTNEEIVSTYQVFSEINAIQGICF